MKYPALFVFLDKTKKFAWILPALLLAYWMYDRTDSPADQIGEAKSALVTAGEEVLYEVKINRELGRRCSATASRYVVDSNGARTDLATDQEYTKEAIERLEQLSPGMTRFKFPVSRSMPSGPAVLFTNLKYRCLTNPLTMVWPIEVTREWRFYVLPITENK